MNQERFNLLVSLTSIKSEDRINALKAFLCEAKDEANSCVIYDVDPSNFRQSLKRLEETAKTVEKIKELDWSKFKRQNEVSKVTCEDES